MTIPVSLPPITVQPRIDQEYRERYCIDCLLEEMADRHSFGQRFSMRPFTAFMEPPQDLASNDRMPRVERPMTIATPISSNHVSTEDLEREPMLGCCPFLKYCFTFCGLWKR